MPNLTLPGLVTTLSVSTIGASRELRNFGQQISLFEKQMGRVGVASTLALSLPLTLVIGATVKLFSDLEDSSIRTISRIKGATLETAIGVQKFVTQLSTKIPLAANEIEEAVDQITRMGGTLDFAKEMTPEFAKFAVVLGGDVREATEEITRNFKALGLATNDFVKDAMTMNDLMNKTVLTQESGGWTYKGTLDAWQKGSAAAKTYGLSVRELAISLMLMGSAGKEGAEAGTAITIVMRNLADSYANHTKAWEKAFGTPLVQKWESMNWEQKYAALGKELGKYTKTAREEVYKSIGIQPRQRGYITPMLEHLPEVGKYIDKLDEQNAVLERFANIVGDSSSQITILFNQFKALGIEIGRNVLPPLLGIGTALLTVTNYAFQLVPTWALFAAAAVPPLLSVILLLKQVGTWMKVAFSEKLFATTLDYFKALAIAQGGIFRMAMTAHGGPTTWGGLQNALAYGGIGKMGMAKGIGAGILAAIPWNILIIGLGAAAAGLYAYTDALRKNRLALLSTAHPSLTSAGFMPAGKEVLEQLEAEKGGSFLTGKELHPEAQSQSAMSKFFFGREVAVQNPLIKTAQAFRDQLNTERSNPEFSIKAYAEHLNEAKEAHAILEEDFQSELARIKARAKSGFTTVGELEGTEGFDADALSKHGRPARYFSAKSKGTADEYRARIMGQQSLVRVADTGLAVAKTTAKATQAAAKSVQSIDHKTPSTVPAGIAKHGK